MGANEHKLIESVAAPTRPIQLGRQLLYQLSYPGI